jgi:hypothetical protein
VVHDPERVEADLLGLLGDGGQPGPDLVGPAGPGEAGHLEGEGQRHGVLLLAAGGRRGGDEVGWDEGDGPRGEDTGEALVGDGLAGRGERLHLGGDDGRRHRVGALPVAPPDLALGDVEHHGHDGDAGPRRPLDVALAAGRLEPGGVDDGGEAAPETVVDHQVQHLEGGRAGPLVALTGADHGPEPVRRHHLVRGEPLLRPRRLAAPRRPDEHHQARIGQPDRLGHAEQCRTPQPNR